MQPAISVLNIKIVKTNIDWFYSMQR